jgi:DNA (cytosine-5)-methyltransferase 1
MTAYYNEFNPEAAHMLRQLIADGHVAPGDVDERSITEVKADDIKGYRQCHWFAGIGGWSVALRLAGWDDDREVWTGSCPCQPFSSAGRQKGKEDERHLWPVWFRLIRESKPQFVFGEQVSAAISHGWWDDVADDLEGEGYTTRAEIRPACSVGAPHKRDRLWFVGNAEYDGQPTMQEPGSEGQAVQHDTQRQDSASEFAGAGASSDVANAEQPGLEGHAGYGERSGEPGREREKQKRSAWQGGVWIDCPDGRQRLVEPSIRLLADGVQHRKPILHALGNAIVPQVAAAFIKATM